MTAPGGTERAAMSAPSAAELVELDVLFRDRQRSSRDLAAWWDALERAWPAIRALLAAAPPREPTEAMLRAGMAVFHRDNQRGVIDFNEIWQAMYDAALGAGERDQYGAMSDALGAGEKSYSAGAAGDGAVAAKDIGQSEPKPSVVARDKYRSGQEHSDPGY